MSEPIPAAPVDPLHQAVAAIITPLAGPLVADLAADVKQDVDQAKADVAGVQGAIQGLQNAADAHGGLIGELQNVADTHSTQISAIEQKLANAGTAVLTNVESDPVTQRYVVLGIVGALIVAALVVLVAALLGNGTASRYIAAVPATAGALVLWASKADLSLPKKVAKPIP